MRKGLGTLGREIARHPISRWGAGGGLLIALALFLPDYYLYILALAGIWAIAAIGLNVLTGIAGQISIGHAGFMAIGAYAVALLSLRLGAPFWLALPAAGLLNGLIGLAMGLPALRLSGPYLAIATLGFGVAVVEILRRWEPVTGGFMGLKVPPPALGPWVLKSDAAGYGLVMISLALLTALALRLVRSAFGRAWIALRDSEAAAQAFGISLPRYRTLAFAISAFYAGVAGGLLAYRVGRVDPDALTLSHSIFLVTALIVGGLASVPGSILGAFLLTMIFYALGGLGGAIGLRTEVGDFRNILYGVLLILTAMFLPGGLWRLSWALPRRPRLLPATTPPGEGSPAVPGAFSLPSTLSFHPLRGGGRLEIAELSKRFGGVQALWRVSFTVEPGEIVGLIGPNGAGKTTALNLISRFYDPDAGRIRFEGHDLLRYRPHEIIRLGIARTFQNVEIFPGLTVLENLMVGQHLRVRTGLVAAAIGWPAARAEERRLRERAEEVLEWIGLMALAHRPAGSLSFGQRKRLELGRALIAEPRLLLLDEPAAGLHPLEREALKTLLRRIREELGCFILLIEHDMDLVMGLCDRVVVLNFGRVIAQGTPKEIAEDPAVREAYLGEHPAGDFNARAAVNAERGRG
ncbi:Sulfate/thiosulfate import ATP-binding protein CysA [Candidatus Thermoflexus japonica]|uniref:Sulfate/thiosulfate import ATP-binding protein CysA n=1 Tax=Candidatus Thermoflexus japonica TaxID=2035417 RepID=A0A2H5Y538_9CHLR|nr:Sulfate/thiosulfate import ATP-binding protein CysA [Candidatus Thermoflexus japonica]